MRVGDILIWEEGVPLSHHSDRGELLPRIAAHYNLRDSLPCYYGEHCNLIDKWDASDVTSAIAMLNLPWNPWGSVPMNYFDAIGVFFALMESKPCWQKGGE